MRWMIVILALAGCQSTGVVHHMPTNSDRERSREVYINQARTEPTVADAVTVVTEAIQTVQQQPEPAPAVNEDACPSGLCM